MVSTLGNMGGGGAFKVFNLSGFSPGDKLPSIILNNNLVIEVNAGEWAHSKPV